MRTRRQGETYDRNVVLPTPESPSRRMGTSGASMVEVVMSDDHWPIYTSISIV